MTAARINQSDWQSTSCVCLQAFPEDGVQAAVEGILSFEGFSPRNRKQIAVMFQARGLPIPIQPPLQGSE